jgi:hypothetical protein
LNADTGTTCPPERAAEFGSQRTPETAVDRVGFDIAQLGQGIEDRPHLVEPEDLVIGPFLVGGTATEVLAEEVADATAASRPRGVSGKVFE